MGGYIRWSGLVDDDTKAIAVTERLTGRNSIRGPVTSSCVAAHLREQP